MTLKDLYIYGAGDFGREVKMIIDQINDKKKTWNIVGFIDDNSEKKNTTVINNLKVVGDVEFLLALNKDVDVVVAIGDTYVREKIYNKLKKNTHISFPNVFHPSVIF
jgi:FlaA1/EpsC-like NDP-sugar epimerase